MSSISTALNMSDIRVGNLVQYYIDYTGEWHDMVIVDIVPPKTRKLYPTHDTRNWVIVMTYIEDLQNTKMYFHRKQMLWTFKDRFRKLEDPYDNGRV